MADSTRKKSIYLFALACLEMQKASRMLYMGTFTFAENVSDKKEAMRRWHMLRERISRKLGGWTFAGCWQRQKRGAWHLHFFTGQRLDVSWLRDMAVECGFGSMMRLDVVGAAWSGAPAHLANTKRAIAYAVRYAVRDVESGEYFGETLFTFGGGAKRGTVNFHWASGVRKLWRLGCQVWHDMRTNIPLRDLDFHFLARIGWESLSDSEKERLTVAPVRGSPDRGYSEAIHRWINGPIGEGNLLEPF